MTIQLYRHAWGAVGDGGPWADIPSLCASAVEEGYEGVEFPLFLLGADAEAESLRAAMADHGLTYLPMLMTFVEQMHSPDAHLDALRSQLERAAAIGAARVNVHAGADAFDDATTARFLRDSLSIASDVGVELLHETHRTRPLYNPWRTARMVEEVEGLRLTADYSHWVCVAGRLPFDSAAAFTACAPAVGHIHARVGQSEAPQVGDPRDPSWATELGSHEHWWDEIVAAAAERGDTMTITPEFGPPPYMPTVPHTGEPVSDLAEIVAWMRDRLLERYR
jgi:sugar phosphate isomerase/epimerase